MATDDLSYEAVKKRALTAMESVPGSQSGPTKSYQQFGAGSETTGNANPTRLLNQLTTDLTKTGTGEGTIMDKYSQRRSLAESSATANEQLLTKQYDQKIKETEEANKAERAGLLMGVNGPGINNVALNQLEVTAKKRVKELMETRDTMLLQNKIAAASQIDKLITDEQTQVTEARKNYYSQLLGLASASTQAKTAENAMNFTLGEGQVRYDQNGNVVARGPAKAVAGGAAGGEYIPGESPTVDSYVTGIRNGTLKMTDVPSSLKNLVSQGLAKVTPEMKNAEYDKAVQLRQLITDLASDEEGISDAVGPISSKMPTLEGSTSDFEAKFNSLKSLLTLENLGLMKGVLSNSDIQMLKEASTPLSLSMSEGGFKKELIRIAATVDKALERQQKALGAVGSTSKILVSPDGKSTFDASDLTPDEYQNALDDGYKPQ